MGLEVFWLDEYSRSAEATLSISDELLEVIAPCVEELRIRTGCLVDPFGNTRLYPAHARLLAQAIARRNDVVRSTDLGRLMALLVSAAETNRALLFSGD